MVGNLELIGMQRFIDGLDSLVGQIPFKINIAGPRMLYVVLFALFFLVAAACMGPLQLLEQIHPAASVISNIKTQPVSYTHLTLPTILPLWVSANS